MADKYPNISPYAYCNWNPVMLVDPDGKYWDWSNSNLSKKDQKTHESTMKKMCESSNLFSQMYNELSNSSKPYAVNIGKTSDNAAGQWEANSNSVGGKITFKDKNSMKSSSAFTEEIFHAYQSENSDLYEKGKSFNREFEAKVAKHFMLNEASLGFALEGGMGNFINTTDKLLNYSSPKPNQINNSAVKGIYNDAANKYAKYNQSNNIGNKHYREMTEQSPKALIKLIKDASQ